MLRKVVRIDTPPGVSAGYGTKITTPDGQELNGVQRVHVTVTPCDVTVTTIELFAEVNCTALGTFFMKDPTSGVVKQLRRIEFEDGSTFE